MYVSHGLDEICFVGDFIKTQNVYGTNRSRIHSSHLAVVVVVVFSTISNYDKSSKHLLENSARVHCVKMKTWLLMVVNTPCLIFSVDTINCVVRIYIIYIYGHISPARFINTSNP